MADKMKKCRNCGKDAPVDEKGMYTCDECGWDEAAHVRNVRSRRLESQIEREIEEEEKKSARKQRGW